MKQSIKEALTLVGVIVLFMLIHVSMLIGLKENEKRDQARYDEIVSAFEDVEDIFRMQQEQIEQYKRDCETITSKVVNGEW